MKHFKLTPSWVLAIAATLLFSCSPVYYQVYEVKSKALRQSDNSMVYENDDVKVMYNLWANGGKVNFIINNKTDRDIFVDMGQSFFIFNGEATDYFQNREFSNSVSMATSTSYGFSMFSSTVGFWPNTYLVPSTQSIVAKTMKGSSKAVTTKEKEIVCIPAHSFKCINGETMSQNVYLTCIKKIDYPVSSAESATYTEAESPSKLRNRISYSFDKNGKDLRQIENDFYLSGITNYSKKGAMEKVKEYVGCSNSFTKKTYYFKIGGPNKFYKPYKKRR